MVEGTDMTKAREKTVEVLKSFGARKSQEVQILAHLFAIGPITPMDALERYGCFRLSARIKDLRVRGVPIETRKVTRNGKTFAEYRLEGDDEI